MGWINRLRGAMAVLLAAGLMAALASGPATSTNLEDRWRAKHGGPAAGAKDEPVIKDLEFSWTGPYMGMFLGLSSTPADMTLMNELNVNLGADNAVWGGRAGFDFQVNKVVVAGILVNYQFGDRKLVDGLAGGMLGATLGDQWDIGARIGVLPSPRTLLYLGLLYTRVEVADRGILLINGSELDGYKLIAGLETVLAPNLTLAIEGSWAKLDDNILSPMVPGKFTAEEIGARIVVNWRPANLFGK